MNPIDPVWGDDLMAIADAVGATSRPHPECDAKHIPHPSHAREFTNLALEMLLQEWSDQIAADLPVALIPTDHDTCTGCGDTLCRCETQCEDLARDVCSHYGKPFCPTCGPRHCPDCRSDEQRWS